MSFEREDYVKFAKSIAERHHRVDIRDTFSMSSSQHPTLFTPQQRKVSLDWKLYGYLLISFNDCKKRLAKMDD